MINILYDTVDISLDTIDTNCFHNKIKTKYLRHASYFPKIDLWIERKQHFMGLNERSQ